MSAHTIALLGKGGSAKTTTSAAVADAFARRGQRTLLVDLDVQTSLSDWLAPRDRAHDVRDVVLGQCTLEDAGVALRDNLTLLPGIPDHVLLLERTIEARPRRREEVIAQWLSTVDDHYDVVILDTPRGLGGTLSLNALEAADRVIVPLDPTGMGLEALRELIALIEAVGEERGNSALLAGVLPTRVTRTRMASMAIDAVSERGWPLLTSIPSATAVAEAVTMRQLLWDYAPDSPAVEAYEAVTDQLQSALREDT